MFGVLVTHLAQGKWRTPSSAGQQCRKQNPFFSHHVMFEFVQHLRQEAGKTVRAGGMSGVRRLNLQRKPAQLWQFAAMRGVKAL